VHRAERASAAADKPKKPHLLLAPPHLFGAAFAFAAAGALEVAAEISGGAGCSGATASIFFAAAAGGAAWAFLRKSL
jgi:hypothetical protein